MLVRRAYVPLVAVGAAALTMAWLSAQSLETPSKTIRGFSAASSALELERERVLKA